MGTCGILQGIRGEMPKWGRQTWGGYFFLSGKSLDKGKIEVGRMLQPLKKKNLLKHVYCISSSCWVGGRKVFIVETTEEDHSET